MSACTYCRSSSIGTYLLTDGISISPSIIFGCLWWRSIVLISIALAHESLKSNLEQIVNILNKGVQDLTPDQDIQEFIREHLPNSVR